MADREGKGRRERIRNNIRDYYDFADSPAKEAAAAAAKSPLGQRANASQADINAGETDLDSEHFSVSKYTTQLLRQESLKGLYETETRLRRNVRELDGELQTLVYDNYSRFIAATDTIRQMRDNVTDMDTKLQALSTNVESIDRVASSISDNLQSHRTKIEQMLQTNQMLRKIQFLVELPDAMKHFVEKEKYHVGVKYWVAGDAILQKHSQISSFHKTHFECRELAQELLVKLKYVLENASLQEKADMEATRQAVEDLRLLHTTSIFDDETRPAPEALEQEILDLMLSHLYSDFRKDIQAATTQMIEAYEGATTTLQTLVNSSESASTTSAEEAEPTEAEDSVDSPTEKKTVKKLVLETFKTVQLETYFQTVRNGCTKFKTHLETSLELVGKLDSKDLSARIMSEVQPVLLKMVEDLPVTILKFVENIVSTTVNVACRHSSHSNETVTASLEGHEVLFSMTPKEAKKLVGDVMVSVGLLLKGYELNTRVLGGEFLKAVFDQTSQFNRLVDQSLVQVFSGVLDFCNNFVKEKSTTDSQGQKGASSLAKQVLCMALVARDVPRHTISELTTGDEDLDKLLTSIQVQFHEACASLIRSFILLAGVNHSNVIKTSMDAGNWMAKKEPTGPSGFVRLLVEEWSAVFEYLSDWFPKSERHLDAEAAARNDVTSGSHRRTTSTGSALSRNSGDTRTGRTAGSTTGTSSKINIPSVANFARRDHHSLASDVDRMFSRKSQNLPLKPKNHDASYIMLSLLLFSLRSLVEVTRNKGFNQGGFQQVQVDAAYIFKSLRENNASWFHNRCDDSIVSHVQEFAAVAHERCSQRSPLSNDVIEALVNTE